MALNMILRCALFLGAAAAAAAQALKGADVGPAAAAVVETDAAPTHLPPNWQPPTTPAALEAFCLALLTPIILIGVMMYTKEKGGSMPGCLAAGLICIGWTYLALT